MDRFKELNELISSFEMDFKKFYGRGNKTAGVRLRKQMQVLKDFAQDVRDEVQKINKENELSEKDY